MSCPFGLFRKKNSAWILTQLYRYLESDSTLLNMATETTFPTDTDLELRFRLQTLINDGGADILWNMFHQRLHSKPLNVFLANEKTNVNRLLEDKKITQTQYDTLYPRRGQPPTSAEFDITLIVSLLINLPALGLNQNFEWHVSPQPKDMSVEADLLRLMGFINEIDHIWSTMQFNKWSYQKMLTEIEQVLFRLNSTLPYPLLNYHQKIDGYKSCPMHTKAKDRIKKKIEQWREIKKGLESKMVQQEEVEGEEATIKSLEANFKELPKPSQDTQMIEDLAEHKLWVEEHERWIHKHKLWVERQLSMVTDKRLTERQKQLMEREKQLIEREKQLIIREKDLIEKVKMPTLFELFLPRMPSEASGSEYGKQTTSERETLYTKPKSSKLLEEESKLLEEESKLLEEESKRWTEEHSLFLPKPLLPEASESEDAVHRWRDCLQMSDKASQIETASELLAQEILPDQAQVRLASSVFGRCSETFLKICSSISEQIKSKSDDVIDVWAAYRYYEHIKEDDIKPVFVVITKKDKAGIGEKDFDVIERDETDFSPESEKVLKEVENGLSNVNISLDSNLTDIEKCVSLNADSLMDKHRNLNIVSPSFKKSKNFGKIDAQISDELCIALYVHIKGLIPIAEEPFPSNIGEFRTDVLEGGFKLFHGPKDYHEQLKMGLAIHANVIDNKGDLLCGTLGGFLDYQHVCICALTCAHVVLTTHEMQKLVTCNQLSSIEKEVFQSAHAFGKEILAVYRTGEQQSSGIDAALIKIIQRHPKDGSFPAASNYEAAGFDERQPMVYKKGKVSPVDGIRPRAEVYKYGISTEVTRGSLGFRGSFVKTSEMSANNQQFEYRLHNQIEVLRIDGACFASPGDSGALVFFDDTENDSVAIGIVEGGHTNDRIVYVTPLCAILDNFGTDFSMTKFINDGSVSNDSGQEMDTS